MSELKVIRTNIQPNNTNVLWLNTDDNILYKFDSNGWEPISAKSSVYTTPFTLIDLVTDFFTQDDGYTMPCPQELVDAVRNGLTIVMPYGLSNSGGYTANVRFNDRDICLEFLLNSPLFDGCLIRMRAIRHIGTGALEFIKGAASTFVCYQPLLEPGKNIKTIAGNDILTGGNLPAKDILKESTVFLEWYQSLEDGKQIYKDKAGYKAHNLKVYKRIATAIHTDPDKIVPNTEMFFVNVESTNYYRKPIHTGILECTIFETLHSTLFPVSVSTMLDFVPIQSISVDCELIINAAEGGEMPVWQGVTREVPVGSNYVKNISFNGTIYSGVNNVVTLPSLMTNIDATSGTLTVALTTNVLVVTSEVTDTITINSFRPTQGMSQEGRVYFHHVAGQPLNINLTFTHYWENGENPSGTITEECFCELTIKRMRMNNKYYDLVSLKTYKQ